MERVALFIDGDNLSPNVCDDVLGFASGLGRVDIARVYGNIHALGAWRDTPALEAIHAGTGKNAADILLALDAMDLCQPGAVHHVVLASSDGDFVHLARRLRQRGIPVTGVGGGKAPADLRDACTEFKCLLEARENVSCIRDALDQQACRIIEAASASNEGVSVQVFGVQMSRCRESLKSRRQEKSWRAYLEARPHLFAVDPKHREARVRLRQPLHKAA